VILLTVQMRDLYAKKEKYYLLYLRERSWKCFSLVDNVVSAITFVTVIERYIRCPYINCVE